MAHQHKQGGVSGRDAVELQQRLRRDWRQVNGADYRLWGPYDAIT
jgi:hypothetical protein